MAKKSKRTVTRKQTKNTTPNEVVEVKADLPKKSNTKAVIAAVILAIVIISVPLYLNGVKAAEIKAQKILSEAADLSAATVAADGKSAIPGYFRVQNPNSGKIKSLYLEIVTDFESSKAYPAALLGMGDNYCDNNQFTEAWDSYNLFIKKFPNHALVSEAIVGRGDIVYKQGKYDMALTEWNKVLKDYNGGKNKHAVELKLADCYQKMGNKDAAKAMCAEVINGAKEGPWADMAKGLLATIK
jgi:TolA-binding protein